MPFRKALVVRRGRQPHEMAFAAACVILGGFGLVAQTSASPGLNQAFGPYVYVWYIGAFIGGLVTISGIARGTVSALLVERIGLCILAGVCLAYASSAVLLSGWRGLAAGVFVGAYGIASAVRVWQIGKDLDRYMQAIVNPTPTAVVAEPDV